MPVSVRIELNHRQIQRILRSPNGMVARNMMRRGRKVQRHARRNVHSRTGALARSIEVRQAMFAGAPGCEVYTGIFYALAVHDGSGIYGPSGRPIRARSGGFLKFTGRGGETVYAKQVRGQRANPFLRDALRSAL
jgi:hypothetical protein